MKKTYVSPKAEFECFATSDIITASVFTFFNKTGDAANDSEGTIDVIDLNKKLGEN